MTRRSKRLGRGVGILIATAVWLGLQTWKITAAATCGPPVTLRYERVRQINRSARGFTEGLIYRDGFLYESTGGYGGSGLNRINPISGKVESLGALPKEQFGEGLESDGQNLYQLTWKEHRLLQWDKGGNFKRSLNYPFEGWGLARDSHGVWVSSDGSDTLSFFDHAPSDDASGSGWTPSFRLPVMNGARGETRLNELEFAQGALYANIFQEARIVRIDPASACVTGQIDLSGLVSSSGVDLEQNPEWVLNGIAYRPETGTFFMTGKNWPVIYEVRVLAGEG